MVSVNPRELFDNSVFFLGAGASRDVDCMTSPQMLDDLKTQINRLEDETRKEAYNEIYRFIDACLRFQYAIDDPDSGYQFNIEDFAKVIKQIIYRDYIIPGPLVGTWNEKLVKWELLNSNIFNEFYSFILKLLRSEWTTFNQRKLSTFLKPVRELLTSTDVDSLNFFSLNYDLVFESFFNPSGKRLLENGFDGDTWTSNFTDRDPNNESKLNLFKLHGSLDWWYNREDEEIELRPDNDDPLIIFGSDNKMHSTDPFLYLLTRFREKLEKAKLVIAIGYSFYDPYLNNIIIQQIKASPLKKLVVVDPRYRKSGKDLFIEQLASIQIKRSDSDIPNVSQVSPEKVQVEGMTARTFFREYFSDDASKLWDIYQQIELSAQPF